MTIYLDDITNSEKLSPFGKIKSIAHIRIGMLTILEKWQYHFEKVLLQSESKAPRGKVFEFSALNVPSNEFLRVLASGYHKDSNGFVGLKSAVDIFKYNDWALRQDFEMVTKDRTRSHLPESVFSKAKDNIFIEGNAEINTCFINAEAGPVYISENAKVMEGAMIRGPVFIGKNSVIKMGAKIYGGTTIGPYCMAGGEIKNSVLMAFSNKAHDGYLGDSVLGEWCNLGAGTSNSNLKNNASDVRILTKPGTPEINAGLKCGLLMGDYSRSAINTSFNTGTTVGVCCNIFDREPGKYIPDFTWGNERYLYEKALRDIDNWKRLKGFEITEAEKITLKKLYDQS